MPLVFKYGLLISIALTLSFLGFFPAQEDFWLIASLYSLGFFFYTLRLSSSAFKLDLLEWMMIIAFIPMPLIFSFPNLSDDIYRFIWDGYCIKAGINPYSFLPTELVEVGIQGLDDGLYSKLNSPAYYSIYPTIGQLFFFVAAFLSDHILVQAFILKAIYLLSHVAGGIAIWKVFESQQWSKKTLLFYYLNPLVIVEGIGNLHAEINMVSFIFIAFYFWHNKRDNLASFLFTCAIMVKLIPLFLMGYFLIRYKEKRYRLFLWKVGIWTFLLSLPILYGLISGGFLSSVDLYFRKFEFNASVYYALRTVGYWLSGYNLIKYIGPGLFLIFVGLNFRNWIMHKYQTSYWTFFRSAEFTILSYLLLSTIIHPWYIISLVAVSVFTQKRYIWVWSFLIIFTYINYSYETYHENMLVVLLEYVVVLGLYIYEKRTEKVNMKSHFLNPF